jgi:hypothetical protein
MRRIHGYLLGLQHHVWVEHCEQHVNLTAARGNQKGLDYGLYQRFWGKWADLDRQTALSSFRQQQPDVDQCHDQRQLLQRW